jgi:large subunit ribosomal protein L24
MPLLFSLVRNATAAQLKALPLSCCLAPTIASMASLATTSSFGCAKHAFVAAPAVRPRRVALQPAYGVIGPGKKWESYELNKNGKPARTPMHVKTGDRVVVIAGDDRGKVGTIKQVFAKTRQVLLDGVNVSMRHKAAQVQGESGERVAKEAPMSVSNVMHWSEEQQTRSRIGRKVVDGKKVRYLKKTGEIIDLGKKE